MPFERTDLKNISGFLSISNETSEELVIHILIYAFAYVKNMEKDVLSFLSLEMNRKKEREGEREKNAREREKKTK